MFFNKYRFSTVLATFLLCYSLSYSGNVNAARNNKEQFYVEDWCQEGSIEYHLNDGTRVDCLLPMFVVEADFADKWYEAIGQSLHYATQTGMMAAILLIVEEEKQYKYIVRALETIDYHDLSIAVFAYINTGEVHYKKKEVLNYSRKNRAKQIDL